MRLALVRRPAAAAPRPRGLRWHGFSRLRPPWTRGPYAAGHGSGPDQAPLAQRRTGAMVSWGYRAAGKGISLSAKSGARLGEDLATRASLHRAGRGARRGFLAPGDATPPGTAGSGYLDYRGVATWREAKQGLRGEF